MVNVNIQFILRIRKINIIFNKYIFYMFCFCIRYKCILSYIIFYEYSVYLNKIHIFCKIIIY